MSVAVLKDFLLSFEIGQPALSVQNVLQIAHKLNFGPLNNLCIKEDSYTPNNDYFWLWQNVPANEAPNFIYLQTEGVVNLSVVGSGGAMINAVPVNKLHLLLLPPNNTNLPNSVYLEGRTAYPQPMTQGVPVNFLAIMAQVNF